MSSRLDACQPARSLFSLNRCPFSFFSHPVRSSSFRRRLVTWSRPSHTRSRHRAQTVPPSAQRPAPRSVPPRSHPRQNWSRHSSRPKLHCPEVYLLQALVVAAGSTIRYVSPGHGVPRA
eukprot:283560-Rhodomonas_salina.1